MSHTEEIVINRSLPIVLSAVDKPIKDTIHKSGSLPGVSGEYLLTKAEFGTPGSRRITCLSDGTTLEEESWGASTTRNRLVFATLCGTIRPRRLAQSHMVSGTFFTLTWGTAAHTSHGFIRSSSGKTNSPATSERFGRFLFRVRFLDKDYAALMRDVLNGYKTDAEQRPADDDNPERVRNPPLRPTDEYN